MGNEMASGEPSYGMAIMSGRRSGKMRTQIDVMAEEIDNLRERCEELEKKRDYLESRLASAHGCNETMHICQKHAEAERDEMLARCKKLNTTCIELAEDWAKAEAERDEARQWAREQYKENGLHRIRYAKLRAQLAEARNKALDEAMGLVEARAQMAFGYADEFHPASLEHDHYMHSSRELRNVADRIRALKDQS